MEETHEADDMKEIMKKGGDANNNIQDDFNASISSDDITLHDKLNNNANFQLKAKQSEQFNSNSNNNRPI